MLQQCLLNIDQKVIYSARKSTRGIFTQRNKIHCSILRKLNGSRKTSLSEFLSQTEQLTVSGRHAAGLEQCENKCLYPLYKAS